MKISFIPLTIIAIILICCVVAVIINLLLIKKRYIISKYNDINKLYVSNDGSIYRYVTVGDFKILYDDNIAPVKRIIKSNEMIFNPSLIDLNKTFYRISTVSHCNYTSKYIYYDSYVLYVKCKKIIDIINKAEDPRSITLNGIVYIIYNKLTPPLYNSRIYLFNTDSKVEYIINYALQKNEKNWTPFVSNNQLYLVYTINPLTILKINCHNGTVIDIIRHPINTRIGLKNLRGGSNLINIDNYYLGVGHIQVDLKYYYHFFYRISNQYPFSLIDVSTLFNFYISKNTFIAYKNYKGDCFNNIQFCCGIFKDIDGLVLSMGIGDMHSELIKIPMDKVMLLFDI